MAEREEREKKAKDERCSEVLREVDDIELKLLREELNFEVSMRSEAKANPNLDKR